MITTQFKKIVVPVLLMLAGVATSSPERLSKETADLLLSHYYPELANKQKVADTVTIQRTQEPVTPLVAAPEVRIEPAIIPVPAIEHVVPAATIERVVTLPVATQPVVVVPQTKTSVQVEEDDFTYDDEADEEKTSTSFKDKAVAIAQKTKQFLSKPTGKAATLAVALGAYAVTKAVKGVLAQHADKHGMDKAKAIFETLRAKGIMTTLLKDLSVKQAFAGIAVDTVVELATSALTKLTQTA